MIIEGIKLALLGMMVVFVFLILLVLIIYLSTWLLKPYTEREQTLAVAKTRKKDMVVSRLDNQRITAVISAAIAAHRARYGSRM